ncbi:lipase family protein [Dyadobacter sp. LJ53]|uniref:lipase family protein n=1 Tax=Dyadobacter chenwenxiniae TaxID=2906456 RepID=UPI001F355D4F|nr:lipase family protein [Dyadobacter chenwenxiniae]MCF0052131.1 lipase family protein [Dyadobacter chenwenxiniae]
MKFLFTSALCLCELLFSAKLLYAQAPTYSFKPGFDPRECLDMLQLNQAFGDSVGLKRFADYQPGYTFVYRSPSMGLDNVWDLWLRNDSTVVILLRGTTGDGKSLFANFYCAMIPAQGEVVLNKNDTLRYQLATEPRAAVHAGWLLGFAFLAKDIAPKLDSLYKQGYKHYLVAGHSQGGALCYYVSAWLWLLQKQERYADLQIKTYASAPPKVGNMYFAYSYDNLTRGNWTFSVVNADDAVTEMPPTVQQMEGDMNQPNPLMDLGKLFKKLPFIQRLVLNRAFNKMRKGAIKSSKAYQTYLGEYAHRILKQSAPYLQLPEAVNSTYFVRPGNPIALLPNQAYYDYFEPIKDGPYYHHGMKPYAFLVRQYYRLD